MLRLKKALSIFFTIMLCFCQTACFSSETNEIMQTAQIESPMIDMLITIGDKTFSAKLHNNQTMRTLIEMFPLTADMNELNGNEKFYYLSNPIPSVSAQPGEIHAGDIMLYGDNCLVLFYKTFSSSYKYTRLGYIVDAEGFSQAVGAGNVRVVFNTKNKSSRVER